MSETIRTIDKEKPLPQPPPGTGAANLRTVLFGIIIIAITLGVGGRMWWRSHYFRETDNAYICGHVHPVSSRIPGVVTRVLISDNQLVRAGELIAELDPVDHRIKIDQIRAQIKSNETESIQAAAQIVQAQAEARAAEAKTRQAGAELVQARQHEERYRNLYNDGIKVVAKAELDAATTSLAGAEAMLAASKDQAAAARARIDVARSAKETLQAQKRVLETQLKDSEIQLSYNRIFAPVTGRIGKRTIEEGIRVQPGQQLLAIVRNEIWVTANFKETQLKGLYPGQTAKVTIDALGSTAIIGRIDSISPASGAQFALLPPDNATGNFTRVVQRIPVKIAFPPETAQSPQRLLVPGMSSTVEIDLRQPDSKGKVAAQ